MARSYSSALRDQLSFEGKAPVRQRITQALDAQGLYGPMVDQMLGVEEPTVDEWEAGDGAPTHEQVKLLSEMTGYPVEFFYLPWPSLHAVTFMCGDDGCERTEVDDRPLAPVVHLHPTP